MTSRGVLNCNPGNLRHNGIAWVGLRPEQTDPDFCQFISPEYGIRAMALTLETYEREGITTLQQMVDRWAPPSENETAAYVGDVCGRCHIAPDEPVKLTALLAQVIPAIIAHECANYAYPESVIAQGIDMARYS